MAGSGTCNDIEFTCFTDSSLGASTDVFAPATNLYDFTTPLAADEAIIDLTQPYTTSEDELTQCVVSLWAYILSHLNQSGGGTEYLKIFIRIYKIEKDVKFRVKKQ